MILRTLNHTFLYNIISNTITMLWWSEYYELVNSGQYTLARMCISIYFTHIYCIFKIYTNLKNKGIIRIIINKIITNKSTRPIHGVQYTLKLYLTFYLFIAYRYSRFIPSLFPFLSVVQNQ